LRLSLANGTRTIACVQGDECSERTRKVDRHRRGQIALGVIKRQRHLPTPRSMTRPTGTPWPLVRPCRWGRACHGGC
jgi:hypothetical protein